MIFRLIAVLKLLSIAFTLAAQISEEAFEQVPLVTNSQQISDILDIIQDKHGYIWVGTDQGLLKLNGNFRTLYQNNPDDPASLPNNKITVLLEYSDNVIWIGTQAGVFQYNRDCDCFSSLIDHNNTQDFSGSVADLEMDPNGNIWIAFTENGLYKYDRDRNSFQKYLDDPHNEINLRSDVINNILIENENRIWIGTGHGFNGNGAILLDPTTGIASRYLPNTNDNRSLIDDRVSSMISDNKGRVFLGTYQCGLHLYHPASDDFEVLTEKSDSPIKIHAPYSDERVPTYGFSHNDPIVELLFQDSKGGYWAGTSGTGLYYFADETSSPISFFTDSKSEEKTTNNIFKCIYEDRQGIIWVGCEGGDLYKKDIYSPIFTYHPGTYNSEVVYESPFQESEIWAGSEGGGLRRLNLATDSLTTYMYAPNDPGSIKHNSVRNVYQESPDILWVGVGSIGGDDGGEDGLGGLDRLNLSTGKFEHYYISPSNSKDSFSHTIYHIIEDNAERLWLAAGFGGIYLSDSEKKKFFPIKSVIKSNFPDSIVTFALGYLSNGDIWMDGMLKDGRDTLLVFDQSNNQFRSLADDDLDIVTNIIEGSEGDLWVSTWSQGVIKYNPRTKQITRFTTDNGLPSNSSTHITQCKEEKLWIGTRYGVCMLDLRTENITPINLNENWFYFGIKCLSDGRVFFSTKNKGLVSFYPDEIKGNPFPPQTKISRITISGEEYKNSGERLTLNHKLNDIKIEFAGLHYSNPSNNKSAYKLIPMNDEWIDIGNEQKIQFQNLRPGNYTFSVKTSTENGIWSIENASLDFRILPPIWKTTWALILYALLLTGTIYYFYQFNLKRTLAQQEAKRLAELDAFKNKFYTNITHEFRTPLTVIEGMADEISRHPERNPEKSVSMIKKNSRTLLNLVNQMLELSKLNAGKTKLSIRQHDVIGHLKHLVNMYESFAQRKGVGMRFHAEQESLYLDTDLDLLEKAITNILSNAIKFTPKYGKVLVVAKIEDTAESPRLHIQVKDKGIGIVPDALPLIFDRYYQVDKNNEENTGTGIGLALTKEIIHLLNGTIKAESTVGKGSTFHIYLPIRNETELITSDHGKQDADKNYLNQQSANPADDLPIVLVIEDNWDVIEYLVLCLENEFIVHTASDGKEGLEMAFETLPDIIISDVMMPKMDGYQVCAALKQDQRTEHIPVILLTARVLIEDRLQGLQHGADAYLSKPFERAELLIRINNLLELRTRLQRKYSASLTSDLPEPSHEEKKIHSFIRKVESIVLDHIDDESFDTDLLASKVHLSKSQLHRKIKSLTGKSTSIYVRSIRLHKAKELLKMTEMNITEISYAVGFNSPTYFSQAFKEVFGESPSKYEK